MPYCEKCGAEVRKKFCPKCGERIYSNDNNRENNSNDKNNSTSKGKIIIAVVIGTFILLILTSIGVGFLILANNDSDNDDGNQMDENVPEDVLRRYFEYMENGEYLEVIGFWLDEDHNFFYEDVTLENDSVKYWYDKFVEQYTDFEVIKIEVMEVSEKTVNNTMVERAYDLHVHIIINNDEGYVNFDVCKMKGDREWGIVDRYTSFLGVDTNPDSDYLVLRVDLYNVDGETYDMISIEVHQDVISWDNYKILVDGGEIDFPSGRVTATGEEFEFETDFNFEMGESYNISIIEIGSDRKVFNADVRARN